MKRMLDVLAELTGVPAPTWRVPCWLAYTGALANGALSAVTRREPKAPLGGVRMAKYRMWFSPAKAVRELGPPRTPPREALRGAVEWFRANGYVKGG